MEIVAEDAVARIPQLDPGQVSRHAAVLSAPIVLEASPSQVLLDAGKGVSGGQLGPGMTSLAGETTHRPAPVEVDLTGAAGAEEPRCG